MIIYSTYKYYDMKNHRLKTHFLQNTIYCNKWKDCGIQLSLMFDESNESLLDKIFITKRKLLLADIHQLVFDRQQSYLVVYKVLQELLQELQIKEYDDLLQDPMSMIIHAMNEHEICNEIITPVSDLKKTIIENTNYSEQELDGI